MLGRGRTPAGWAIVVALGLTGVSCASEATDARLNDRVTAREQRSTTTAVTVPAVHDWENPGLPSPFSVIAGTPGIRVYQAVVDTDMVVVGVSSATGEEQYRLDAHPLRRRRGVLPEVLVDEARGLVFRTLVADDAAYLAANDLFTGAEVWRSAISFSSEQPFDCDAYVCVRSDASQIAFDRDDGQVASEAPADSALVYGTTDDGLLVSAGPRDPETDDPLSIVGLTDLGQEEAWDIALADIEERSGVDISPAWGWGTVFDESGAGAIFIAVDDPDELGAVWTGFDRESGEVLWTRKDTLMCTFDANEFQLVMCRRAPDGGVSAIERIDLATGEPMWSTELGQSVPIADLGVLAAGDAIQVTAHGRQPMLLSIADGTNVGTPTALTCSDGSRWVDIRSQWDIESMEAPWDDDVVQYRAAGHEWPCSTGFDGMPFGQGVEALGPFATSVFLDPGDGWLVGADESGVVSGHYLP